MVVVALCAALVATPGSTAAAPAKTTTTRKSPPTTSAEAVRKSAIDTQIKSLRQQVEEASAEEAILFDRIDEVAANRRDLEARIAALDAEIAAAEAAAEEAAASLSTVTADLARAETKLQSTTDDLRTARTELTDRAVRAYIHQPGAQMASVLLERQSFRELAATRSFLRSFVNAQAASVARYRTLRSTLDGQRSSLSALRDDVVAQRDLVAVHRDDLVSARSTQDGLRASAASEELRQKALLAEVKSKVKTFEAEIAALKKESDAIASLLRKRQSSQRPAPSGKGVLGVPVPGAVTSVFGWRVHPLYGSRRMHNGVDFAAAIGTPVRAAGDGTVVAAGARGGYGNVVVVDHDNSLATLSAHLSRLAVADGARVARGQVIGYAGATGLATGPHLHFEVRVAGNPVDPLRFL